MSSRLSRLHGRATGSRTPTGFGAGLRARLRRRIMIFHYYYHYRYRYYYLYHYHYVLSSMRRENLSPRPVNRICARGGRGKEKEDEEKKNKGKKTGKNGGGGGLIIGRFPFYSPPLTMRGAAAARHGGVPLGNIPRGVPRYTGAARRAE